MSAKKNPKSTDDAAKAAMDAPFYKPAPGPGERPLIPLFGHTFTSYVSGPVMRNLTSFPNFPGVSYDVTRTDAAGTQTVEKRNMKRFFLIYSVGFPEENKIYKVAKFLRSLFSRPGIHTAANSGGIPAGGQAPDVMIMCDTPQCKYYSILNKTLKENVFYEYGLQFANPDTINKVYLDVCTTNTYALVITWTNEHPILPASLTSTESCGGGYRPKTCSLPRNIVPTRTLGFEQSAGLHSVALSNSGNKCWWIHLIPAVMFLMNATDPEIYWGNLQEYFGFIEGTDQEGWQNLQTIIDNQTTLVGVHLNRFKKKLKAIFMMNILVKSLLDRPTSEYLSLDAIMMEVFMCFGDTMDIGDGSLQQDGSEWIMRFSQCMLETRDTMFLLFPDLVASNWNPKVSEVRRRMLIKCQKCNRFQARNADVICPTLQVDVMFQDYLDDPNKVIHPADWLSKSSLTESAAPGPCEHCGVREQKISRYRIMEATDRFSIVIDRKAGPLLSGDRLRVAENPISTEPLKLKIGRRGHIRYVYYEPRVLGLSFVNADNNGGVTGSGNYNISGHWRSCVKKGNLAMAGEDGHRFLPVCLWEEVTKIFGSHISVICYQKMTAQEVRTLGFDPDEVPPVEDGDDV